ncbi:unnamed protein product, partial [Brassica oleracea var. botrytis]
WTYTATTTLFCCGGRGSRRDLQPELTDIIDYDKEDAGSGRGCLSHSRKESFSRPLNKCIIRFVFCSCVPQWLRMVGAL